ncbi:sodium:calcium antiporter [Sphingomonas sp. RHCKR7]|uniref:sodium:calcium antiporter n=1 Tax=Sphingomonas folli TaxID=2862497 RepID=UPI001CA52662|nr:sodium:calcium antiporter [Sphingomonas folli]MBW6526438.1 sodium:calcium antiporter [Sphingomonas folli]
MFDGLGLPILLAIFAACAGVIWIAGVKLADTTDILSARLHLGKALGGIIVLALATNLPEIAITVSAALAGNLGVAVGNILGGIAIQTVVLVAMDVAMKEKVPLSYRAASLTLVVEAVLVVAVLIVSIMATQLPSTLIAARLTPGAVLIAVLWVVGVWLASKASEGLPWQDASGTAPDGQEEPKGHSQAKKDDASDRQGESTIRVAATFGTAALATLAAGVLLERSGDAIADHIGLSGVLFGATVLAAATSLPELSTGITSVRMKDYQLAVSDIFGGNAFLPVLFLLAVVISGKAVLPDAEASDIYLAGLGVLLTCVYAAGLIFRPRRQIWRMGIDSFVVLVLYALGLGGLFAISGASGG